MAAMVVGDGFLHFLSCKGVQCWETCWCFRVADTPRSIRPCGCQDGKADSVAAICPVRNLSTPRDPSGVHITCFQLAGSAGDLIALKGGITASIDRLSKSITTYSLLVCPEDGYWTAEFPMNYT
jgi:hypothetical protein